MTRYQCNVRIEDNGGGFLIVVRDEALNMRLVVAAFQTLGDAWRHIVSIVYGWQEGSPG